MLLLVAALIVLITCSALLLIDTFSIFVYLFGYLIMQIKGIKMIYAMGKENFNNLF
jgi:hypothetical protein